MEVPQTVTAQGNFYFEGTALTGSFPVALCFGIIAVLLLPAEYLYSVIWMCMWSDPVCLCFFVAPAVWSWWTSGRKGGLRCRWWWAMLWRRSRSCRRLTRRQQTASGAHSSLPGPAVWTLMIWGGEEGASEAGWRRTGSLWQRRGMSWRWRRSWPSEPLMDLKTAAAQTRSSWTASRDWSRINTIILDRTQRLTQNKHHVQRLIQNIDQALPVLLWPVGAQQQFDSLSMMSSLWKYEPFKVKVLFVSVWMFQIQKLDQ